MTSVIEKNPALADMSIEEIQELLKEKQNADLAEKQKKRKAYESQKEELINTLGGFALSLKGQMLDLKCESFAELTKFREKMLEYGDLRGKEKNKGSFELKNERFKIIFRSQISKSFDERAELAEAKLKEFLSTFVKKKDKSAYSIVMALLERNDKTGDFDINLINRLYKMRDQFDNPLWHQALDLFQESYSPYGTAQYIQFLVKNDTNNSYEPISLDFAKIKGEKATEATDETAK